MSYLKRIKNVSYAPIMLTVFNRPEHAKKVLESLAKNELAKFSELYIYSDGPRKPEEEEKIKAVRDVLKNVKGFKKVTVVEAPKNKGLANSVITGVTDIVNKYGKVIVLEDDLLTQKYFLNVMNQMLDSYESDTRIAGVTAFMQTSRQVKLPKKYKEDIFFNIRPCSTGWGTWKNRWERVDWKVSDFKKFIQNRSIQKEFNKGGKDLTTMLKAKMEGKVDSWAIRWTYHVFKNNLAFVQTTKSYIDNIGYDASGINSKDETYFFRQNSLAEKKVLKLIPFKGNITWNIVKKYVAPYTFGWAYIKKKLYSKLGILIKF